MLFNLKVLSGVLMSLGQLNALKVGLLSDLHLQLRYDEEIGTRSEGLGDCMAGSGELSSIKAPIGRYGCDSPPVLIETMLSRMVEKFGELDVILITGDFAAHHISMSSSPGQTIEETYALLLETLGSINEMISVKFPNTLVLPAFGNNDSKYHDAPIPKEDAPFFYTYVFNLWFKLLPGNFK